MQVCLVVVRAAELKFSVTTTSIRQRIGLTRVSFCVRCRCCSAALHCDVITSEQKQRQLVLRVLLTVSRCLGVIQIKAGPFTKKKKKEKRNAQKWIVEFDAEKGLYGTRTAEAPRKFCAIGRKT